jgi:cell filamentation protein
MSDWRSYFYPNSDVLQNKLGITDAEELEMNERFIVEQRIREGCPEGNFDLDHLQAIHRHLFQDVYEWAGDLRTVSMMKGQDSFIPPDRIEMGMNDVHRRMVEANFLKDMDVWTFAAKAAEILGDVNHVHPFREGNGRTQLQYLQLLGEQAGHTIDLTKFERETWIQASIEANRGSYGAMNDQIRQAIVLVQEKILTPESGRAAELQTTLPPEEVTQLREALKIRQEKERQDLLDKHKAERTEVNPAGDKQALEKLTERHALEIFAQDKLHKEELPRYMREREEARRLEEEMEQRRHARDLELERKGRERGR